jgi:fatty acid desaturase
VRKAKAAFVPEPGVPDLKRVLSREEIADLTTASDLRGLLSLAVTWGMIAGAFALVAWRPHPVTVAVALVVLGGRQLALAVLMHECSHRALFRSRALNDHLGRWLCGAPIWQRLDDYRAHHMRHHNFTGTARDPDLGLVTPFPTTCASVARKLLRDLSGLSGLKRVAALLAMDLGFITYTASTTAERTDPRDWSLVDRLRSLLRHTGRTLLVNGVIFGVLWATGQPLLYLLWAGAWLTTFSLFVRIRAMAEHACTAISPDVFANTRTVRAGWLARLVVCPHDVCFHLEHHLLMTVPHYKLRRMHELLTDRGALEGSHVVDGYLTILRLVSAPAG